MKKKYIIHGEPFSVTKLHHNARRVWDKHEQALFVRRQELVNQHGDQKKPYSGKLYLDVTFYFMTPCSKPHLDGKEHQELPPLNRLITFIERLGEDIIFVKDAAIAEIKAKKLYDYEPRTEIIIIKE